MIMIKWRCVNTVILLLLSSSVVVIKSQSKGCPPQDAILPCRCLMKGDEYQIWCSHSDLPRVLEGLKAIGQYIVHPIDELILENNFLPSLPGRTFFPLKVMRLMLRYNRLERVSSDWLAGLESSLMELFIVEPNLRSLPEDSIVQLNDLEAVTIQTNLLKRLPLFFRLPKLRYLQVESLSLLELLPRRFKDLPSLEIFHISGSPRLIKLESGLLEDLPRLKLINITYCGINWISPRAMSQLPMLKELSLIGNKISDAGMVGRGSRDLINLETIRLDQNQIDKLGEATFVDMPALKKLYLSNNRITDLYHGAFHRVPSLKVVDLTNNMLRRIHPESFLQPSGTGLDELLLINNDISHVAELRSLLDTLPKLTFLDMSYNNLEVIPFGALRGHPTLERLHLDYNKIHMVDPEALMAMPALRELRLKNNSLSDILEGPLWNLPALKGLDLSGNLYRRIEQRLLANLPSLRKLDMSQNELTIIEPTSFLITPELEHINVSYNELTATHPSTFRHLLRLYELDASHNRLLEFIPGLPRGIEYLHLSYNQIGMIPLPPSPDLDLPSLRMLDLSGNGIQRIPQGSFKTMPQVRKLYLTRNSLHSIESHSFEGLSRLEMLNLEDNRITNIHPKAFTEMIELRDLNFRNNRLDILVPDLFKSTHHLKKLDVSNNLLAEILPGTLEHLHDLVVMDASYNALVKLPPGLQDLKKLRYLDLTSNRLKIINPAVISSLISLTELKVSRNYIQDLKKGAFDNLPSLKVLNLDKNEIEIIEPFAMNQLPALKMLKLNENRLRNIPPQAFNNLPSLQVAELQDNKITRLAKNTFHIVPHLLLLNLSNNHLTNFEEAGLQSLRSLEMLDISNNKISRIESSSLEKMEWLVELRADNNQICSIHGSPFNDMSRLRVLSFKNNRMVSLPEHAVQNLRGNIAVLDIDGNPFSCTCQILWLKGWLQETSHVGPRCTDGTLVREMRLSRQECTRELNPVESVAPGCEAELLSAPSVYDTSQVFTPWMKLKSNNSKHGTGGKHNNIAPLPEESDYFYDDYVDYPYNDTLVPENNAITNGNIKEHKSEPSASSSTPKSSHHYVTGDTPTIYAASKNKSRPNIPKEIHNSPSTSGFTFFGVPLPSINFNNLWGNNKNNERKPAVPSPVADRKTAIVNKPSRSTPRAHIIPSMSPPSTPEIQTGGFVPLLPGSGGFKPIPNPQMQIPLQMNQTTISKRSNVTQTTQHSNVKATIVQQPTTPLPVSSSIRSNGHPIPLPTAATMPTIAVNTKIESTTPHGNTKLHTRIEVIESTYTDSKKTETSLEVVKEMISNSPSAERSVKAKNQLPFQEPNTTTEISATTERFEDLFQGVVENVSVPNILHSNLTTDVPLIMSTSTKRTIPVNEETTQRSSDDTEAIIREENINEDKSVATPLSALLVPGGQQPHFRPAGRPTITKVPSPFISNNAPLHSNIESPLLLESSTNNRESKTTQDTVVTEKGADIATENTNWYFANYNKTNIEPYIGGTTLNKAEKIEPKIHCLLFIIFLRVLI